MERRRVPFAPGDMIELRTVESRSRAKTVMLVLATLSPKWLDCVGFSSPVYEARMLVADEGRPRWLTLSSASVVCHVMDERP